MEFTIINNKKTEQLSLKKNLTIKELLDEIEKPLETVVIKKNGHIVLEEEIINEGDTIEVIQIIYGG
ncbi:MAG: MoaD/ThiS family protein [Euryarchaeota archaeon]|nr:MoaD/ThiS family protein [Euryarchaeota archaeon]MBV1730100.1 MoaD/ThiS family protein [Methanobacterium sp.]MBU4548359.1 MoaD/ThiS family protein [Euryarchaeota archaeon]MBU4607921.1 MoaD/ThiS family protein [Euryarchaeota archaeon]MBV1755648.1 MoaD/ThiS family protein [Methanobacterium sp.]